MLNFYHPERGYWETTNEASQEVLDTYPEGTLLVPKREDPNSTWNGEEWVVSEIPLSKQKEAKLATLSEKRWLVETGGITVNGLPVYTDDRSKLMITGARLKAETDIEFTTNWVGSDGSVITLNATMIITISNAVLSHVDACFNHFATMANEIKSAVSIEDLNEIDINSGWPE